MDTDYKTSPTGPTEAIVRFLRQVSDLAATAAREIELGITTPPQSTATTLDDLDLGSLQTAIVRAPGMDSEEGVKPRVITEHLGRSDEPNVRTTLQALAKRGIAEMVPGSSPQRWRLVPTFR